MKVNLREKKLKNGKRSLYLDFYPPIIVDGKKTRREFLRLYPHEKPKTEEERDFNKETRMLAESLRSKRQLDLQANPHDFVSPRRKAGDFTAFIRAYVESKKSLRASSRRSWNALASHFIAFTGGGCAFGDIDAALLERFRLYLLNCESHKCRLTDSDAAVRRTKDKPTLSSNTAKVYFERFLTVVKEAHQQRYLSGDPTTTAATIKPTTPAREFLTLDELKALAATPAKIPDALRRAALFSALTGLRLSDIENLTWANVRTGGGETSLHTTIIKTGERIVLPISGEAREILGEAGAGDQKAIKNLKYDGSTNVYIERWTQAAGIGRRITFHAFRRTYATGLLANGVDFHTISGMLGHSDLRQTQIYAKLLDEKKRAAANKISLK